MVMVKTSFSRETKKSLLMNVSFKVEAMRQKHNHSNDKEHHVNTFAQQHLEHNILHRACLQEMKLYGDD